MVVATDVLTTVERLSAGHSKSKKKKKIIIPFIYQVNKTWSREEVKEKG